MCIRDSVLTEYPPNATDGADNRRIASRAIADYSFTCGTRRMLAHVAKMGLTAAAYRFDQRAAADTSPSDMGVEHGDEVPFVFDQGAWIGDAGFTPEEEVLATTIGRIWSNFSRTGTVPWPVFGHTLEQGWNQSEPEWLFRAGASRLQPYSHDRACNFWDQNVPL